MLAENDISLIAVEYFGRERHITRSLSFKFYFVSSLKILTLFDDFLINKTCSCFYQTLYSPWIQFIILLAVLSYNYCIIYLLKLTYKFLLTEPRKLYVLYRRLIRRVHGLWETDFRAHWRVDFWYLKMKPSAHISV